MSEENIEYYQEAISILFDDQVDYRKVVIKLAKDDPKKFVQIIRDIKPVDPDDAIISLVRGYILQHKKIHGIKLWREEKGWGLKESKDFVDNLEKEMIENGEYG